MAMAWQLQTEDGQPVELPLEATSFRGNTELIEFATPPLHASSTGRVYTQSGGQFFPNVFGLKWVKLSDEDGELNAAVRLMSRIGGSFAAALAAAYWVADSGNRARILAGWPEMIDRYRRMVRESSND
jgi:hypothetical protein